MLMYNQVRYSIVYSTEGFFSWDKNTVKHFKNRQDKQKNLKVSKSAVNLLKHADVDHIDIQYFYDIKFK